MATNPNNAIGTNGAYGGRTSVNAFNDVAAAFESRGILSGWALAPDSGMTIALGGNGTDRDVALAEDNAGNKTTINNITEAPVEVTIPAAPGANSRIDAVVAYVQKPPQGDSTITDNYEACGLIVVQGAVAASPAAPTEQMIRSAITADGSSGATAYYVVLGYVNLPNGTTDITADMLTAGDAAKIKSQNVDFATLRPYLAEMTTSVTLTTANQNLVSLTLPAGTYVLAAQCACKGEGDASVFDYLFRVISQSTGTVVGHMAQAKQKVSSWDDTTTMLSEATFTEETTIVLQGRRNTGSGTAKTGYASNYSNTALAAFPVA